MAKRQGSRTCIYCMRERDGSAFRGREHVVHRAFGKFQNSPTLDCVCDECNRLFGENIDLDYTRDSLEALLRLLHGTKPAHELGELRKSRVSVTLGGDDPGWRGCHVEWVEEDDEVVVGLVPQVGFRRQGELSWVFVTEDALQDGTPSLPAGADNAEIRPVSNSEEMDERLIAMLARRGIKFKKSGVFGGPPPSVGGFAPLDLRARFDDVIYRCVGKIAFNYLAWREGADFVRSDGFNPLRAFVRNGTRAPYPLVGVCAKPVLAEDDGAASTRQTEGHLITASWTPDSHHIVGQVSLFNSVTYAVSLARDFAGVWRPLRTGHHFDYRTGRIKMLNTGRERLR
jgi:HNH endonuclease